MLFTVFITVFVLISVNKFAINDAKNVEPKIAGKNILLIYADDLG